MFENTDNVKYKMPFILQKLDLEIQGHQPIIEKVQGRGEKLIEDRHVNAKAIKDKLSELQVSWDDLLNKAKVRKKNLDLSVQIQRVSDLDLTLSVDLTVLPGILFCLSSELLLFAWFVSGKWVLHYHDLCFTLSTLNMYWSCEFYCLLL